MQIKYLDKKLGAFYSILDVLDVLYFWCPIKIDPYLQGQVLKGFAIAITQFKALKD